MTPEQAHRYVVGQLPPDFVGRFYSSGGQIALGKGKVYDSVPCPIYDPSSGGYLTAACLAYILTHECDIDDENNRSFSAELLICPILKLEDFVSEYEQVFSTDKLSGFLANLGQRNISRLIFLPPIPPTMPYGGILYLNQITHTQTSTFETGEARAVCAVTAFGLAHIEYGLENHFLRPKADQLAFAHAELPPVPSPSMTQAGRKTEGSFLQKVRAVRACLGEMLGINKR